MSLTEPKRSPINSATQILSNATLPPYWLQVALDVPLEGVFDYRSDVPVTRGLRVIVPFGRRQLIGVVVACPDQPSLPPESIKPIERVLDDLPPLTPAWLDMAKFAADYYQRPLGEVMLPVMPARLRSVTAYTSVQSGEGPVAKQLAKQQAKQDKLAKINKKPKLDAIHDATPEQRTEDVKTDHLTTHQSVQSKTPLLQLNASQQTAVDSLTAIDTYQTCLLFGVTGSGKTEVYLAAAAKVLESGRRVLFLVPEINLTPQFAASLQARLAPYVQPDQIALMHSGLTDTQRQESWVRAAMGDARIVLGTRMAIFAPLSNLGLIVVDEEHDPSYKQQEGLRYSARDLAVWRGRQDQATVVLGSATPSLESWAQTQRGHYKRLDLPERAHQTLMPNIRLIDTRRADLKQGLTPQVIDAMTQTLEQKQQVLVFLNRRGYAPVLHCPSCGWLSQCKNCSVFAVLHRDQPYKMRLHCHHCGQQTQVPKACPECGDQDLQAMGRGTQRLEEHLTEIFPQARLARIDADSTRTKGSAQALFEQVHAGLVDILVGTQMVSKGHDFARLGLVVVLNADSMLFSQDFRAPERLFAQLMQVAGRAGRHQGQGQVLVQTGYPDQPVYRALCQHDYPGFAQNTLEERKAAQLPPYVYQALLTAQARELNTAIDFLQQGRDLAQAWLDNQPAPEHITLFDPVPLRVTRVAQVCRAQLLVESPSRAALHQMLRAWLPTLGTRHARGQLRWQLEVDPLEI
jgi:primosomal protein N' (replication factor Y)